MSHTKQIKVGFLHKLGSHDNWKKRYFVLDSNNELSFYANEESTEILGRLRIQPKTVCEEAEGPAHLGKHFSIQTSLDSKAWKLCAASEAERMVWMESIRNAARSLMTSDLKSGKKKFPEDDIGRKAEESPSKAKSRHLNIRNRGHGRSRSEDININALNEALKERDEAAKKDKKMQRKSDRKSTKGSELIADSSLPNISVNNINTNNTTPSKLGYSSDEIGPMSLPVSSQDRSDDTMSELSDGLPNMGQGAHRTKSANIKIDLKSARRGDAGAKSPRRRMMQSGPLSPTKGLAISTDQADNVLLPRILEQVEKPMPVITESEFQVFIEEFKASDFSDTRKQLISSNKQRLTCQQVAEFYDQIDYAEERILMLSTFIPRIPDLESFDEVVLENILLDAEKEKAREIYKQHQDAVQKQKQELLVQQQLLQLQQQATQQVPATPVKIHLAPSDPDVHTPSESESRSARSSQSVDAAKRRKPFQGHRRNVSVPLSLTSNDSSSNPSAMDGPTDILFEDQDHRVDFNMLRRIESYELEDFIKFLKETPFINKRREGIIKLRRDHLLTCEDLSKILDTLTFGDEKVKAIYLLYDSLMDKDTNIKTVSSKLTFQSEKIKVRELLPIS